MIAAQAGPDGAAEAPLIRIQNLTKLYRMGDSVVRALDGVSLDIQRGEFVAIIGPSGSGKSTMMHLLGCLDRPTRGRYLLDGQDVSRLSDRALAAVRNQQIGFVFQTFNLINRTTAVDNVGVPLFYARQSETRAPALRALERVGLAQRSTHRPSELSGGERQRVAIARAIVNDPVLLLADEPTGNLDTRTGEQILDIFRRLNEQGVTIIIVTHEPDIAMQARRIVAMRDGRIISDRQTSELGGEWSGTQPRRPHPDPAVDEGQVEPATHAAPALAVDDEPPRVVRSATVGLILGITGLILGVLAWIGGRMLRDMIGPLPAQGTPELSGSAAAFGGGIALALLLGMAVGLIAVLCGRAALKRMRAEPGHWSGRGQARLALALGAIAMCWPCLLMTVPRLF